MLRILIALHLTLATLVLTGPARAETARVSAEQAAFELPWQRGTGAAEIAELGRGVGIVFSPDLATKENRAFYEQLGFTYFETARWNEVLRELKKHQSGDHERRLRYLVVESHGANGNGLKLQEGKKPEQIRSYISIGALQQAADKLGIDVVLLSACNAGRLLRPEIYNVLDRSPGDPMFLPPTGGVIDADRRFDPSESSTTILRRKQSRLETLMEGKFTELPSSLRRQLEEATGKKNGRFVISTMLIQLMLSDRSLQLTSSGFDTEKSRGDLTAAQSERLFKRFVSFLASSSPVASARSAR